MDDNTLRIHREAHGLAMTVKRADLYKAAAGMPARSQASKDEMARWLIQYAPERIAAIPRI